MKVSLLLLKKSGDFRSYDFPSSVTVIGRRKECEFCIPLKVISRRHCEFNQDGDNLTIRDLNSRNGTFVNGEKIHSADLKAGDEIAIGPLKFIVQIDGLPRLNDLASILGQLDNDASLGFSSIHQIPMNNTSDLTQSE